MKNIFTPAKVSSILVTLSAINSLNVQAGSCSSEEEEYYSESHCYNYNQEGIYCSTSTSSDGYGGQAIYANYHDVNGGGWTDLLHYCVGF